MPTRIPVCIADKPFPSLNQARVHYQTILHRYQPGQTVNEQDRYEVEQLIVSSGVELPVSAGPNDVRVVLGHYGRSCFARCGVGESPQVISIMRSVKKCVLNHGDNLELQASAPSAESVLNAANSVDGQGNTSHRPKKMKVTCDIEA